MRQFLAATQATGDVVVSERTAPALVMLAQHAGGTWTLQFQAPNGDWIDSDITFVANGGKAFRAFQGLPMRMHGGTAGALAWTDIA